MLMICVAITTNAQDDLLDMLEEDEGGSEKVFATFKGIRIVNANTIETTKKKTLEFRITHRFGNMGVASNGGGHTLWGFDQASNIRFSFDYGVTDRLMIGIGRSKTNEHIDGSFKYRILEQTEDFKIPVSIAWYSNAAFSPQKDIDSLWSKVAHRFSYTNQLIIASKITPWLSLEVLPTIVHRNFVRYLVNNANGALDENTLYSLGFAGRIRITKRSAIVFDYFHTFGDFRSGNPNLPYYDPLSIGWEVETGGHVFHINLTNSAGIIAQDFIPNSPDDWSKGGYKFGFNISRVFNF